MAHPKEIKRQGGKLWHLEDSGLTQSEAKALKKHLVKTEEKKSHIKKASKGYEVWWAK